MAVLGLLLAAGLIAVGVYSLLRRLPVLRPLPLLYLVVEKEAEEVEWFIRGFCRRCRHWRLVVVDRCPPEARLILAKLAEAYGFELTSQVPLTAAYVLRAGRGSSLQELRGQLAYLQQSRRQEEKACSRRI